MVSRVLDLGCGTGKWPKRLGAPPDNLVLIGVDISYPACVRASQQGPNPRWICVCARGEQLPLNDNTVEFVVSTVGLPYMNIPATLSEIRRVLRPGGFLDVSLHPFWFTFQKFRDRPPLTPRKLLFRLYVVANGLWFHLTGCLFRYPFASRFESWQSERSMRIALRRAGFAGIRCTHLPKGCLVVHAHRPSLLEEVGALQPAAA